MDRRRVAPRPQDRSRRADVVCTPRSAGAWCFSSRPLRGCAPPAALGGGSRGEHLPAGYGQSRWDCNPRDRGWHRTCPKSRQDPSAEACGDPDADFDWLLTDLTRGLRSLAFTVDSPVALPVARSSRERSSPYEDLVFLRSATPLVSSVAERIARNPHRRTVQRDALGEFAGGGRLDPSRLWMLTTGTASHATVDRTRQVALVGVPLADKLTRAGQSGPSVRGADPVAGHRSRYV